MNGRRMGGGGGEGYVYIAFLFFLNSSVLYTCFSQCNLIACSPEQSP